MTTKANLLGSGSSPLSAQAALGMTTTGLTATGNSQGTALPLPSDFCVFTTVGASTGTILPSTLTIADYVTIVNHGANALSVYPPVGGKIGVAAINAALSVASGKTAYLTAVDSSGNFASSVSA